MVRSSLKFSGQLALAAALLVMASLGASAQGLPGNAGTTGGPPGPAQSATAVPLDGGASLLLASGVALGVRRLRLRRKSQQ
ncbi:MAG: hypothetical protein EOO59_16565 [Hymenobacter sp.]|nr:MAG: hypothetical protein EOO59_16565 [Hymenobacter sp.]